MANMVKTLNYLLKKQEEATICAPKIIEKMRGQQ
jgi:hypothetical protein